MSDLNVKILIVDDLAEKLLVYRSILEESGLELITAQSGAEALRQVLQHEFAVILLDVNMPDMDGFETASLIRSRKRCAHTPIIFITAYADELHAIKGYSHGAVDYILSPVVPEILQTKVRVFVELFRKNLEVQQQAEMLRQLELREHRQQLNETTDRLNLALEAGRMGAWEWDLGTKLMSWSPMLEQIFGMQPGEFSGSLEDLQQRIHAEDRRRVVDTLTQAAEAGQEFRIEHRIIRRGIEVAWVEVRGQCADSGGPNPGRISGVCMDITDRKRAEHAIAESERRYRQLVHGLPAAVYTCDAQGRILLYNEAAAKLWGREPDLENDRWCGSAKIFTPSGHTLGLDECPMAMAIRDGVSVRDQEVIIERPDGTRRNVMPHPEPILDGDGRVVGAVNMLVDITERKLVEQDLERHREHLEQLVMERTAELESSHERLRLADRLASIGTLAAGLGHDMGNLLLPVRLRLDTLQKMKLDPEAAEHIQAIATCSEYLKKLSHGLRLFALDPDDDGAVDESTDLAAWWPDVEPFLRNALPRGVRLEADLPADVPAIVLPSHRLTQVVFNLVQNAGDAMRERASGTVRVSASLQRDGRYVALCIQDDGPGMSEEIRRRCMDPFFTTKTRGISTGLGLALVRGAVLKANGSISIESQEHHGTMFRLSIPCTQRSEADDAGHDGRCEAACVALSDARLSAYLATMLRSMDVDVLRTMPANQGQRVDLLITDSINGAYHEVERFLSASETRRALLLGRPPNDGCTDQVQWIEPNTSPARIREVVLGLVRKPQIVLEEVRS